MNKSYLILATSVVFAACSSDDIANVNSNTTSQTDAPKDSTISFNLTVPAQTRATLSGAEAATKLSNEFVVFGIKNAIGEGGTATNAFTNYVVKYDGSSAGTSQSNTNNWEYVGQTPYAKTKVSPAVTTQTVKYWDYSATNGYTFTAFAGSTFLKNAEGTETDPVVSKTNNGYTVKVPANTDLSNVYFSDRVTVAKTEYGKPVTLTFRNFGTKVRVGFYSTVQGYSVSIDKFYCVDKPTAVVTNFNDMQKESTSAFVASLQNVNATTTGGNSVNVSYYDASSANANQVKVSTSSSASYQYTLTLGSNIIGKTLGDASTSAVWDKENGDYTTVFPNLDNANPMLIRCDYTLTSTDGSGEQIHIKNARVTVPTQYVQWKSNYAYTYLFKISTNTNGTTGNFDPTKPGEGDKEGLFPITFDAVVVGATDYSQETTTTVATNNVTSYAKDGYTANKDIYFVNTSTSTKKVIAVEGTTKEKASNAVVYSLGQSTAVSEGEIIAKLTGTKVNGLTLSELTDQTGSISVEQYVPSADGTKLDFGQKGALKFTPKASGKYAYVYCTTAYVAPTYSAVATDATFTAGTTYYYNTDTTPADGVYYIASGITTENFGTYKSKLYTKTNDGTAGVYDVKVIVVE